MSEKLDNLLNKILEIKKQQITMQISNPGDTAQPSNSETVEVRQEALLRSRPTLGYTALSYFKTITTNRQKVEPTPQGAASAAGGRIGGAELHVVGGAQVAPSGALDTAQSCSS